MLNATCEVCTKITQIIFGKMVDSDGYTSTIFDGRFDGFDLIVFVIVFSIFMCGFMLLFLLQYVSKHYCYDPENEDEVREEVEYRLTQLFDLHEEIEIQLSQLL